MTLFTILAGTGFVDALALGVLEQTGSDPLALSRTTILLPTRRSCRSLREAFLRHAGGRPMLLPRLSPLGDIDPEALGLGLEDVPALAGTLDLPPTLSDLDRQLLLGRLIMAKPDPRNPDRRIPPDQAAWLAADLGRLIDEVETEGLGFESLDRLAPAELAEHWQITLEFLAIVTKAWPAVLAERGAIDAAGRRNAVLRAQAAAWRTAPPADPVIAAGLTGGIPAVAELLAVVAGLPQGAVVLPGLDLAIDDESWDAVAACHPQFGMKQLLSRLGRRRSDVRLWPASRQPDGLLSAPARPDRVRLAREIMRPAETSDAWRARSDRAGGLGPGDLDGLTRIECPTPQDEANTIALMMRATLETPGRTAALVTPDRALARRVALALERWGVAVDDSAGRPLAETAVGSYLRLAAACALENAAPIALLALLTHPLAAGGETAAGFRDKVRAFELLALRGPRPAAGFAGLKLALGSAHPNLAAWLERIEAVAAPFFALIGAGSVPLRSLLLAHLRFAESLARSEDSDGAARLWHRADGEAAKEFMDALLASADAMPDLAGRSYPGLLDALMAPRVVRPRYGEHPRLSVWGLLEARLQQPDLIILAGLNEGTWPTEPAADPWMSRPMRQTFGLPAPECRIGAAAHDFAQALAGAEEVVLSRAIRVDGVPTVPCRWLMRLDTVLAAAGLTLPPSAVWPAWAGALDRPDDYRPARPPTPRPPVAARPRALSVAEIGTWMADPYAIYAAHVLRLQPLEPLEADPGAADRGRIIHAALGAFLAAHPQDLPPDAYDRLLDHGRAAFGDVLAYPDVRAFWWPRFARIARWVVTLEAERRRAGTRPIALEKAGAAIFDGPAGPFTLRARTHRIDRTADGRLAIIRYKTGLVPTAPSVAAGYAPQLPLEAAMLLADGFDGIAPAEIAELAHWRLSGGAAPGEIKFLKAENMATLIREAREGLLTLIATFDDPATPYLSQPRPSNLLRRSPYDHLARVAEWSAGGEGPE